MLSLSKYSKLDSIKEDWKYLYNQNRSISPFLEYDYFKRTVKLSYYYRIIDRCKIRYYVIRKNNIPIMIAPILHYTNGTTELFGRYNGYNYSDFLYDTTYPLDKAWEMLMSEIKSLSLYKVKADSRIIELVDKNTLTQIQNVAIHFGTDYDKYFSGLSKSVRQNIRTAYNRLIKDNHNIKLINISGGVNITPYILMK